MPFRAMAGVPQAMALCFLRCNISLQKTGEFNAILYNGPVACGIFIFG